MQPRNVAILIFDGVQIIDFTGPYEVFGQVGMGNQRSFKVFTVAEKAQPVVTAMGMSVNPHFDLENSPDADILMVPGGNVMSHLDNERILSWLRARAAQADAVLSVCNGAFFLAKAGLLDGLQATTTAGLTDRLQALAPKVNVVDDRRFVDNGKIVTTAGLSSGIDGALHIVSKLLGQAWAYQAALGMEYDWRPESNYVRGMLPDANIPAAVVGFIIPGGEPVEVGGDLTRWIESWKIQNPLPAQELDRQIRQKLTEDGGWTEIEEGSPAGEGCSTWAFTDRFGQAWQGRIEIQPIPDQPEAHLLKIRLDRQGESPGFGNPG
jgi:putative intracellular protease/amidase